MSKLKRFIWTLLTAAASANFAFQDDEDFSDHRFRRESSGDYDSSGDGPEVSFFMKNISKAEHTLISNQDF